MDHCLLDTCEELLDSLRFAYHISNTNVLYCSSPLVSVLYLTQRIMEDCVRLCESEKRKDLQPQNGSHHSFNRQTIHLVNL